jgi:hypothetical protein
MRYAKPIGCTLTAPWNLLAAISAVIVPSAGSTQTFPSSPHTSPLALTDDYAMSALTVGYLGKPDQICSLRDFLRMTRTKP